MILFQFFGNYILPLVSKHGIVTWLITKFHSQFEVLQAHFMSSIIDWKLSNQDEETTSRSLKILASATSNANNNKGVYHQKLCRGINNSNSKFEWTNLQNALCFLIHYLLVVSEIWFERSTNLQKAHFKEFRKAC